MRIGSVDVPRMVPPPDVLWLLVIAPFLSFPYRFPRATVAVLAVFLVEASRRLWSRPGAAGHTPADLLLAIVLGAAILGTVVSYDLTGSVPKLASLTLGVLAFRSIHRHCQSVQRVFVGVGLMSVLGAGAIAIGALSAFGGIETILPSPTVPRQLGAQTAVHPNGLAGLTLLLGPGWLVLFSSRTLWRWAAGRTALMIPVPFVTRLLVGAAVLLAVAALALSGSRSGVLGFLFSLGVVVAIRFACGGASRTFKLAAAAVSVLMLAVPVGVVVLTGARFTVDLETRFEIWERALMMIQAFPLTGVGLNAFTALLPATAPLQQVSPALDIAHAHNVYQQTALDIGLPGFAAYLGVMALAAAMCVAVVQRGELPARDLALALFANVVAVHLFGVTDAIALGTKVGAFLWMNLGLLSGLHSAIEGRA
jgi:O-antigen ligase